MIKFSYNAVAIQLKASTGNIQDNVQLPSRYFCHEKQEMYVQN